MCAAHLVLHRRVNVEVVDSGVFLTLGAAAWRNGVVAGAGQLLKAISLSKPGRRGNTSETGGRLFQLYGGRRGSSNSRSASTSAACRDGVVKENGGFLQC